MFIAPCRIRTGSIRRESGKNPFPMKFPAISIRGRESRRGVSSLARRTLRKFLGRNRRAGIEWRTERGGGGREEAKAATTRRINQQPSVRWGR